MATSGFSLADATALLSRTPGSVDALLRGLPGSWILATEGDETWSPWAIVGHLVEGERTDWMPRLHRILDHGETVAFDKFDRDAQFKGREKPLAELLDEFARLRRENLAELESLRLTPQDLARRGKHPSLGTVTLSQLLATWVAHDLTHVHQLSRVLAHQYREAVGPWTAYLGVMQCNGHSE